MCVSLSYMFGRLSPEVTVASIDVVHLHHRCECVPIVRSLQVFARPRIIMSHNIVEPTSNIGARVGIFRRAGNVVVDQKAIAIIVEHRIASTNVTMDDGPFSVTFLQTHYSFGRAHEVLHHRRDVTARDVRVAQYDEIRVFRADLVLDVDPMLNHSLVLASLGVVGSLSTNLRSVIIELVHDSLAVGPRLDGDCSTGVVPARTRVIYHPRSQYVLS
mmetsp:Transcript_11135/g.33369  ORF Transcript_11135/g.33369 Transcript_11135/m.33369 type:complete len:216 (-) Transcript_11135:132-779(-)